MCGSTQALSNSSISAPRLLPSAGMRNTALPPLPWSGLTTRSPRVTRMEFAHVLDAAGDQRRRHEAREIEHEDLFGRIAHAGRIVDHQRLPLQPLKQVRGGDVGQVERRILPHQHHVDILYEVDLAVLPRVKWSPGRAAR
jgi:hypothetical protein